MPVVLVALINENPLVEYGVKFIKGDPSSAEDLKRAGVSTARAAVVITDESDGQPHTDSTYDARAVLSVLAIKVGQPGPPRRRRGPRSGQSAALSTRGRPTKWSSAPKSPKGWSPAPRRIRELHGCTRICCAWTARRRCSSSTCRKDLDGKTFQSALVRMNTRENSILLGVVEGSEVILCPPNDHIISRKHAWSFSVEIRQAIDRDK